MSVTKTDRIHDMALTNYGISYYGEIYIPILIFFLLWNGANSAQPEMYNKLHKFL